VKAKIIYIALALVLMFSLVAGLAVAGASSVSASITIYVDNLSNHKWDIIQGGCVLWGVSGINLGNPGDYSEVFRVDTDTGLVTIIGVYPEGSVYSDIAETPNGNLYTVGMDRDGITGSTNNFYDFYRLDPATGAVLGSWLGVFTKEVNALCAESDTSVLAVEVGYDYVQHLLRINLDASGNYASIDDLGALPSGIGYTEGDLANDPTSGNWYGTFYASAGSEIWELDTTSPASSSFVSQSNITGAAGLAFCSEGTAYAGSWYDRNLYRVNITGGGSSIAHDLSAYLAGSQFGLSSDNFPPAAPIGLIAIAGDTQVSLDWDDNIEADLAGYDVYRSTTGGTGYAKIATTIDSEYTDTDLTNGTTYYYMVTALDTSNNESGYSNEDNAMPEAAEPPPGGCFIATAAYGTSSAAEIDVLREFRDEVLLESAVGSQLVEWYYQTSPPVADFISGNSLLRTIVRELVIDPMVSVATFTQGMWGK
jgi:hypothetical protein